MEPRYNQQNLTAVEFLRAVMRDPSVAIEDRLRAASALLEIEGPDGPPKPSLTITLPYELGVSLHEMKRQAEQAYHQEMMRQWEAFDAEQQAYFNSLPQAEQDEIMRVLNRLLRCNELDIGELKATSEVKGHA
jgi:hypothetical protein